MSCIQPHQVGIISGLSTVATQIGTAHSKDQTEYIVQGTAETKQENITESIISSLPSNC